LGSHASDLHFFKNEVFAAPASGLPSLPTALLSQLSCASADPMAKADISATIMTRFMSSSSVHPHEHGRAVKSYSYPAGK
jgi:hypothetical protein